jgi:hypothetical protein
MWLEPGDVTIWLERGNLDGDDVAGGRDLIRLLQSPMMMMMMVLMMIYYERLRRRAVVLVIEQGFSPQGRWLVQLRLEFLIT